MGCYVLCGRSFDFRAKIHAHRGSCAAECFRVHTPPKKTESLSFFHVEIDGKEISKEHFAAPSSRDALRQIFSGGTLNGPPEGDLYNHLVATWQKVTFFNEVLAIARKHGSKVKVFADERGYSWIEPTDPEAQREAKLLWCWDGKGGSTIDSISTSQASVVGDCDAGQSNNIRVLIQGHLYQEVDFGSNHVLCESSARLLNEQLAKGFGGRVKILAGEDGRPWIEPLTRRPYRKEGDPSLPVAGH
jgi:hypothetical protein